MLRYISTERYIVVVHEHHINIQLLDQLTRVKATRYIPDESWRHCAQLQSSINKHNLLWQSTNSVTKIRIYDLRLFWLNCWQKTNDNNFHWYNSLVGKSILTSSHVRWSSCQEKQHVLLHQFLLLGFHETIKRHLKRFAYQSQPEVGLLLEIHDCCEILHYCKKSLH